MMGHPDNWRWYGYPPMDPDTIRWGPTTRVKAEKKEDFHQQGFVIARVDTARLDLVQYACSKGFILCDTLVYYKGKGRKKEALPPSYWDRYGEGKEVSHIALEAFSNYQGHYHADPFTRDQATDVYVEWTERSKAYIIDHERCEFPMVHRTPVAYGVLAINQRVELVVGGVLKSHRGKGLYRALVMETLDAALDLGLEAEISTQVTNTTVQRAWCDLGLKPYKSLYTLHGRTQSH